MPAKKPDTLSTKQAAAELQPLAAEIAQHDIAYHQKDAPTITDAQYDALRRQYNALAETHPEAIPKDSAAQKVGAAPAEKFKKVTHRVAMLSLDNAFADED